MLPRGMAIWSCMILTQGPGPLGGAEGGGDDILVSRIVKMFVDALEGVEG